MLASRLNPNPNTGHIDWRDFVWCTTKHLEKEGINELFRGRTIVYDPPDGKDESDCVLLGQEIMARGQHLLEIAMQFESMLEQARSEEVDCIKFPRMITVYNGYAHHRVLGWDSQIGRYHLAHILVVDQGASYFYYFASAMVEKGSLSWPEICKRLAREYYRIPSVHHT